MEASLMASSYCNPQTLPINNRAIRSVHRAFIFQTKQVPITRSQSLKIRSNIQNKVRSNIQNKIYEDHETGIVCYRGDDGELICEGLDEGPRYEPPATKKSVVQSRKTQVLALLGQSQIELVESVDFLHIGACTSLHQGEQECIVLAHFY